MASEREKKRSASALTSTLTSKQNFFPALACVFLCLLCLSAVAWFVKATPPAERDAALLSGEDDGRLVAVVGALAAPRLSENGFSGLVCSSRCIPFFVPRSVASEISFYSIDLASLRSGARLRVEGVAREDSRAANGMELSVVSARGLELLSS